mmetsp:Transcript_39078/g.116673  ORF Transcript_39078/g.116673 Transcript_39078/m.116673 type:complete len:208 (+) Transcript_39078:1220-1843(+)
MWCTLGASTLALQHEQRSGSAPFADTALSGEATAGRRFVAAGGGHLPGRRREARDAAMAAAPGWALGLPARRSRCHPRAHTLPVAAMAARTARPRDAAHGQRADGAPQRRLRSRVQRLSAAGGASLQRAGARLWARPPRELRPGRRRARRRARGAEAEQRAEPATRRAARHASAPAPEQRARSAARAWPALRVARYGDLWHATRGAN